jgi:ADP-ribose pyrophosphatase YjhB (NUDIX family)
MAYIYPFRMASGTATMLVIDPVNRKFLNGIRSSKAWVYPGANSLPGGFMEARFTEAQAAKLGNFPTAVRVGLGMDLIAEEFHEGENLEQCAIRELQEELNTTFSLDQLNLFAVRSNSRTDTRAHVINTCYWLEATPEQIASITPGDDLEGVSWESFDNIIKQPIEMAFNHMEVTYQGLRAYFKHKFVEHIIGEWVDSELVFDFQALDHALAALEKAAANG